MSWALSRSGFLCAGAGQGLTLFPAPLCPPAAFFLRCAPDTFSLDEVEHFPGQSRCQRHYAPMVFGIIPECRSASFGTSVELRRNPHWRRIVGGSSVEGYFCLLTHDYMM
jgi:hypothetical protein